MPLLGFVDLRNSGELLDIEMMKIYVRCSQISICNDKKSTRILELRLKTVY